MKLNKYFHYVFFDYENFGAEGQCIEAELNAERKTASVLDIHADSFKMAIANAASTNDKKTEKAQFNFIDLRLEKTLLLTN